MSEASPSDRIARLEQAAVRHVVRHADGGTVWRRFGKGRPLVLLHGGHGSWLHWVRNVEALGSAFELWVPDLPGYGDSALPSEPAMHGLVTATRESLDALIGAHTPIALAGFSFGGLVALHLARFHSKTISGSGGLQELLCAPSTAHACSCGANTTSRRRPVRWHRPWSSRVTRPAPK